MVVDWDEGYIDKDGSMEHTVFLSGVVASILRVMNFGSILARNSVTVVSFDFPRYMFGIVRNFYAEDQELLTQRGRIVDAQSCGLVYVDVQATDSGVLIV
jgi:hypothetical protein